MTLLRRVAPLQACLALACLLLAACAVSSATAGAPVTPVPTVAAPLRGPVLVQYCADDTGSYPRQYFGQANQLVAQSIVDAVGPNSQGLTLFATAITSNTFASSNTLAPFVIPATPDYPALPTPLPTPSQANPISYSATATAIANQQNTVIASYNSQVAAVNAQVATVRTQVAADAKRLTSWNPPIDANATSVWGCLQLARQRFAGQTATKYLIIASDMENNTNVDYTADFQASQALKGVIIHVIYYACQSAGACQGLDASWTHVFTTSGAASVRFDDPAQSGALTALFGGA